MKKLGLFGVGGLAMLLACGSPAEEKQRNGETTSDPVSQPIVNGTPAPSYLEAALVDTATFACSGAVIAPKVVLTAGHCVASASSWTVRTPFSGNQSARGSSSWTLYKSTGESVNPSVPDVALIFLDTPITLAFYPPLASTEYPDGTIGINVGRIQNNKLSNTALFAGAPIIMRDATPQGFPFDYISNTITESGDSGGPVYVGTGASRVIAAVCSGGGGGTQVMARTDAVYAELQRQIDAHGGGGGGSSSGGSASPPPAGPSGGGACVADSGSSSYASAHPLGACAKGELGAGGNNWYSWNVAAAGVAYDLELKSAGDAQLQMWKTVDNGATFTPIANDTPTGFRKTSSGAGKYLVVVVSPSGTPGTYDLTLAK